MEFHLKYRPKSLKDVRGQDEAVKVLSQFVKQKRIPHAVLLQGPSGVGKTTIARILATELGCDGRDFAELNCADFRGIDMIRDVRSRMSLAPNKGTCRIWLIDEAGKLTGDAQAGFLKILEDVPRHVYFFLATTDPQKLLTTVKTRCSPVTLKPLTHKHLQELILMVVDKEGFNLAGEEVVEKIIEAAQGSARAALVLLEQISTTDGNDLEEQLEIISSSDVKKQGIDLARALMNPRVKWPEVAVILKEIEGEPESIRYIVLGYAKNVLLGGGKMAPRAFLVITAFEANWYDGKAASMVRACWEVLGSGSN